MRDEKSQSISKIMKLPENTNLSELIVGTYANNELSHMVFELDPKDELQFFSESQISAVSKWALDLALKKCKSYRTRWTVLEMLLGVNFDFKHLGRFSRRRWGLMSPVTLNP
jgi:hypothetical protein